MVSPISRLLLKPSSLLSTRYNVISFENDAGEDVEGYLESSGKIKSLIAEEIARGTPSERIVLGGFSQGGVMTLVTGITIDIKLAGLVVMSGRLPIKAKIKAVCAIKFLIMVQLTTRFC